MIVHRYRQSWLNTFMRCPEQARTERAGETVRVANEKMILGTAVHAAIEHTIRYGTYGYGAAIQDAIESESWTPDKLGEAGVTETALAIYDNWLYNVWCGNLDLEREEGAVQPEVGFEHLIHKDPDREIWITGTADLLLPDRIIDWKTSQRKYTEWEHQRWNLQSSFYTLALNRPLFQLCVLIWPQHDVQWVTIERNEHHHQWLTQQLLDIALLDEVGLAHYPRNDHGWHCAAEWCANWGNCKGAFMPDNWKGNNR